jgi:hypothetical protein
MIPIYKALRLEEGSLIGGTTLPSLMIVCDNVGIIQGTYVVKVFDTKHIEQYNPTNKEIIANYLAGEFDLSVPKMAIIQVPENIIEEMLGKEAYKNKSLKAGFYFGCEYIDNTTSYQEEIKISNDDDWELETIFAFDALIINVDRVLKKPNILFKNGSFILIDHELSLNIERTFEEYKAFDIYRNVLQGTKGKHIFLEFLQLKHKKESIAFDDFMESLRYLNLNKLKQLSIFLKRHHFNIDDFEAIISYLEAVKRNTQDFRNVLQTNLQR